VRAFARTPVFGNSFDFREVLNLDNHTPKWVGFNPR
jgi:hypothetical protein